MAVMFVFNGYKHWKHGWRHYIVGKEDDKSKE